MKNTSLKDICTVHIWITVYTIDGTGINYQKWKKKFSLEKIFQSPKIFSKIFSLNYAQNLRNHPKNLKF